MYPTSAVAKRPNNAEEKIDRAQKHRRQKSHDHARGGGQASQKLTSGDKTGQSRAFEKLELLRRR